MDKTKEEFIYHKADDHTLIMTSDGEGTCFVSIDKIEKSCAYIYNVSVEDKHRKRGYGNKLLKEAENVAQNLGANVVSLIAENGKFMVDWYKRKGYKPLFSDEKYTTLYKNIEK